jgi:hypothetical protein
MLDKNHILENIENYSVAELVTNISNGILTFDDLSLIPDSRLSAEKRSEVHRLLNSEDLNAWQHTQHLGTIEAINEYLRNNPEGEFRQQARAMKAQLETAQQSQFLDSLAENAWALVDKNNATALRQFVCDYPQSQHVSEAIRLVNSFLLDEIMGVDVDTMITQMRKIQTDRTLTPAQKDNNVIDLLNRFLNEKKITKEEFLRKLDEDHNLLSAGVVKRLMGEGTLNIADLLSINIDRQFIQKMYQGESTQSFPIPERLEKINKQSTEIYFWGIPSSGKSCALGGILSVAAAGKVAYHLDPDTESQGYGYMKKLINLFQEGQVGSLMEGTSVDSFYEMGFDLIDNEKKVHPITCIDMAGELMRCMFKYSAGDPMSETDEEMLDIMTNVLVDNRSTNRKMHFFVLEYGAEDRLYEGLPQRVYLEGAVDYIKNTGIFQKDTDHIYIMITKADRAKNASRETLYNYIEEHYRGFYHGLQDICEKCEINGGQVEKVAFSLGEVCLQNYCKFDPRPAENIVKHILKHTVSYQTGKRGFLRKIFSK